MNVTSESPNVSGMVACTRNGKMERAAHHYMEACSTCVRRAETTACQALLELEEFDLKDSQKGDGGMMFVLDIAKTHSRTVQLIVV